MLGHDGDVPLRTRGTVQLEKRNDSSTVTDRLLGVRSARVFLRLAKLPPEKLAERFLHRLDFAPLVLARFHRVHAGIGEASTQQREAHPDSARVFPMRIVDMFEVSNPVIQLILGDAVDVREMLTDCGI